MNKLCHNTFPGQTFIVPIVIPIGNPPVWITIPITVEKWSLFHAEALVYGYKAEYLHQSPTNKFVGQAIGFTEYGYEGNLGTAQKYKLNSTCKPQSKATDMSEFHWTWEPVKHREF